jgi:hypothetical protein
MPRPAWLLAMTAFLVIVIGSAKTQAEDAFYRIALDDLKLTAGKLPGNQEHDDENFSWNWRRSETFRPYLVVDNGGEGYFLPERFTRAIPSGSNEEQDPANLIHIKAEADKDVTGRIYLPKTDFSGMVEVKFTIPADKANQKHRTGFYQTKSAYYQELSDRQIPGGAWWRYQVQRADRELGQKKKENAGRPMIDMGRRETEDTFDLFTGGRAISENLQLDRPLGNTEGNQKPVDIDTLKGITVAEIDWSKLTKDLKPTLDPLAEHLPADQHVVFFPTFKALIRVADEAEIHGTPVLRLAEPRAEDAGTIARYQQQLCMSLSGLGRIVGPQVVKSIALTGSDLNYRTGTDIAVLFETTDPASLEQMLLAKVKLTTLQTKGVESADGEKAGLKFHGYSTADRKISCYIAKLPNAVLITNSLYQVERLGQVQQKKTPTLASLPEFAFFRERYKLGNDEETALAFLSDATIRRWCGPRWRIASSRQLRELGVMTHLEATYLDKIVTGKVQPGPVHSDTELATTGELSLASDGIHSSRLGSLEFLTPIAELPLTQVTKAEADAYDRWRNNYQSNWRWAFDPIALRLTVQDNKLAADLSVMPLIWGSDYKEIISITRGAEIKATSGDPHATLVHFVMSLNTQSPLIRQGSNFVSGMVPGGKLDVLSWLGESIAIYADDAPIWDELAKLERDKWEKEMSKSISKLPIALQFEVSNPFKATLFLSAVRAFIEQTAPGMTQWESIPFDDETAYVKITASRQARGMAPEELRDLAIYYAISGNALTITLNETVVKNSLQRQVARMKEKEKPDAEKKTEAALNSKPWLGKNLVLSVDKKLIDLAMNASSRERQSNIQSLAWSNLPILNEWHRLYPDRDPVAVHEQVWKTKLVCPGGGKYVWNDSWQTLESTVFGHPGEPKDGPVITPGMLGLEHADFGLTFEEQGLRARAVLERKLKKE